MHAPNKRCFTSQKIIRFVVVLSVVLHFHILVILLQGSGFSVVASYAGPFWADSLLLRCF